MFCYHQSSNYCITSPVDACDNGRGEGGEHDHLHRQLLSVSSPSQLLLYVSSNPHIHRRCPAFSPRQHSSRKIKRLHPPRQKRTTEITIPYLVGIISASLVAVVWCGGWGGESGWRPERSSSVIIILTSLTFVVGLHHTRQRHSHSFHYSEQLFCYQFKRQIIRIKRVF